VTKAYLKAYLDDRLADFATKKHLDDRMAEMETTILNAITKR
jgi:hypothetical protein